MALAQASSNLLMVYEALYMFPQAGPSLMGVRRVSIINTNKEFDKIGVVTDKLRQACAQSHSHPAIRKMHARSALQSEKAGCVWQDRTAKSEDDLDDMRETDSLGQRTLHLQLQMDQRL